MKLFKAFAINTILMFNGFSQVTINVDEFSSNLDYFNSFGSGSGTVSTTISPSEFSSGTSSLRINYSFNPGSNSFFTILKNYGTTQQDYSYLATGFSIDHMGGNVSDQIGIRIWEDINGNGSFDGEDEVYQSENIVIGSSNWTTSTFDINSFTKVVGDGNGLIDLNRIRAWDIKISNATSTAHNSNVSIDNFSSALALMLKVKIIPTRTDNIFFIRVKSIKYCEKINFKNSKWTSKKSILRGI